MDAGERNELKTYALATAAVPVPGPGDGRVMNRRRLETWCRWNAAGIMKAETRRCDAKQETLSANAKACACEPERIAARME